MREDHALRFCRISWFLNSYASLNFHNTAPSVICWVLLPLLWCPIHLWNIYAAFKLKPKCCSAAGFSSFNFGFRRRLLNLCQWLIERLSSFITNFFQQVFSKLQRFNCISKSPTIQTELKKTCTELQCGEVLGKPNSQVRERVKFLALYPLH